MSIHIASINGLNLLPTTYFRAKARDGIIQQMADHLVAGVAGGLDILDDRDTIFYLLNTPERYGSKVVRAHIDAAVTEARQTIAVMQAMQEGQGL